MTEALSIPPARGPGLCASAAVGVVRAYQFAVSPLLPAIFGASCACRFSPTCSDYAAQALGAHGALKGTWLAARRIVKCTPLHPGGHDPVPPADNPA